MNCMNYYPEFELKLIKYKKDKYKIYKLNLFNNRIN